MLHTSVSPVPTPKVPVRLFFSTYQDLLDAVKLVQGFCERSSFFFEFYLEFQVDNPLKKKPDWSVCLESYLIILIMLLILLFDIRDIVRDFPPLTTPSTFIVPSLVWPLPTITRHAGQTVSSSRNQLLTCHENKCITGISWLYYIQITTTCICIYKLLNTWPKYLCNYPSSHLSSIFCQEPAPLVVTSEPRRCWKGATNHVKN